MTTNIKDAAAIQLEITDVRSLVLLTDLSVIIT